MPILASRKDSSFQSTLNNEIAEASANVLSDRESSLSFEDFAIAYRQKRSVVEGIHPFCRSINYWLYFQIFY